MFYKEISSWYILAVMSVKSKTSIGILFLIAHGLCFARRLVCSLWAIRLQGHAHAALSSASAQLTAPIMAAAMPAQAPAAVQQDTVGPAAIFSRDLVPRQALHLPLSRLQ